MATTTGTLNSSDTFKTEPQLIFLKHNESSAYYRITSNNLEIKAPKLPSQNRVIASNKIKVNKMVSYDWEKKFNYGNIVAAHKNDQFFAYSLKGKTGGNVRIFHKKSNLRSLLPTFNGKVIDLSFADCDETLLGCIDEFGHVKIFQIELDITPSIQAKLLLHILPRLTIDNLVKTSEIQRIIWCMFISDSDDCVKNTEDDASKVFVVTSNRHVDIYHLDLIEHNNQSIHSDSIAIGHLRIEEHESSILTAAFSPDALAIATACANGEVKFFKLSFTDNTKPTCVQIWKPHDSRPVTSLFFLDDHKDPSPNAQIWRYILTGCDYNTEIKIWSCEEWKCLQTIRFTSDNDDIIPCLKANIDRSAEFLVMSDINRKVFYVLHLFQNATEFEANAISISEYPLTCPALSYAIVDSKTIITKNFNRITASNGNEYLENEYSTIQLYCIQTSQLQEMEIMVNSDNKSGVSQSPSILTNMNQRSSLSFSSDIKDRLSDIHCDLEQDLNTSRNNVAAVSSNFILNKEINTNHGLSPALNISDPPTPPILLTPDAFLNQKRGVNSTNDKPASDVLNSFMSTTSSRASSLTHVTSCVNAAHKIGTQPGVAINHMAQSLLITATTPQENFDSDFSLKIVEKPSKYEAKRLLSDSSTSSSSSSSSGLSLDAADKEIEAISLLPDDYIKTEIKPDFISKTTIPSTPPSKYSQNGLLGKVDLIDNEYENENGHLETNGTKLGDEQHQRIWPNLLPNLVGPSTKQPPLANTKSSSDQNLLLEIIHMMRSQQNEIEGLKKQQTNTVLSLKSHFDAVVRQQPQSSQIISEDNFSSIVNHALATQIIPKLEGFVKEEIRQSIQPQVMKIVEPFREQIPRELAEKLSATENLLKDSIAKMFKSKGFLDSISQSVGNGIQSTIVNAYRDSFQKIIVPGFEKSCQSMYQQINATFKKGSDDYIQELENYLKQQRKLHDEQKDPIISQLKQYSENFQSTLTQLNTTLTNSLHIQVEQNLRASNAILQDTIISSVKAIIKEELNVAMRDQQQNLPEHLVTLMRQSGTMTPVIYSSMNEQDTKQRLQTLMQMGQYSVAFQSALCASDLSLLVGICEMVSASEVFAKKPCPLQQPQLLSLIQQLSQELHLHTELKITYLEYACMSLDRENVGTRDHIPAIISLLQQKINQYLSQHPNEKPAIVRQMKILIMASESG